MSDLIELINSELPQYQCGRCDTPGCRPYAESIINGAPHNRCVPGGQKTLDKISILLESESMILNNDYGPKLIPQVAKIVEEDCIGCTKCIDACPVDAITGAANLMHSVIDDLCTGCELCIEPCPVDCIELMEVNEEKSLGARNQSEKFFNLKSELNNRKIKKAKFNKSFEQNLNLADSINGKLKNRGQDQSKALLRLQVDMLEAQKKDKSFDDSDINNLIEGLKT
jgi:Na+-translocating ferredoxin:NAD+ oxidoreductase subunit B